MIEESIATLKNCIYSFLIPEIEVLWKEEDCVTSILLKYQCTEYSESLGYMERDLMEERSLNERLIIKVYKGVLI